MSCLKDLDLDSKLLTITADNASNNGKMISEIFDELVLQREDDESFKFRFQGQRSFVRCFAHILNLIVKEILSNLHTGEDVIAADIANEIDTEDRSQRQLSLIDRIRVCCHLASRTPQRRKTWKRVCRGMGKSDAIPQYDIKTRWNSTYRMLEDAVAASEQVDEFLKHFPSQQSLSLSRLEWARVKQMVQVLKKFNDLTLEVSKVKPQITLSLFLYYELLDYLQEIKDKEGDYMFIQDGVSKAIALGLKKYEKYYTFMDEQNTHYIAALLDPRIKCKLLQRELDQEGYETLMSQIRSYLHKQYPVEEFGTSHSTPAEPATKERSSLSRMFEAFQQENNVSDIDIYLDSPAIGIDTRQEYPEDWIFTWWKTHAEEFPQMARIARDFLAIPMASTSVERLFNSGRDLIGLRRHSLQADTIHMLVLLRNVFVN